MENTRSSLARGRVIEERKIWRRDQPYGFWAKPNKNPDGSLNLFRWNCGIPGKANTIWEGYVYRLIIDFGEEYPSAPPKCKFEPVLFHPNVYPSGNVCLSTLNEDEDWRPNITVKQILFAIQELMSNPNANSPAQQEPYILYTRNREEYNRKVKDWASKNAKKTS